MLGANALSELAAMLPQSGGQYVYAERAFGPYVGFVVGWSDWASTCGSVAAVAIVLAESAGVLAPPLEGHTVLVALGVTALLTAVLWSGVRSSDRAQRISSAVKAVALIALVVACFSYHGPLVTPLPSAAPAVIPAMTGFVVAMQGVIYTYDGWTAPLYFSEEVTDPGRELPRSILGGLALIMGIYLALNAGFLHVVSLPAMATSQLPAATAAAQIFGARGDAVVRWIVVLALPSTIVACLLAASRVVFGLSRDGLASGRATR